MKKILLALIFVCSFLISACAHSGLPDKKPEQKRDTLSFELMNSSVKSFLKTDYSNDVGANGYTLSYVDDFSKSVGVTDKPVPVTISWDLSLAAKAATFRLYDDNELKYKDYTLSKGAKSITIWNLVPGRLYRYQLLNSKSKVLDDWFFKTTGQVRMIDLGDVYNVRDLGGWASTTFFHEDKTPKHIGYGKIFRGSEFNTEKTVNVRLSKQGISTLLDDMGVTAEVDFRTAEETGTGGAGAPTPWLENKVKYVWSESQSYKGLWGDGGDKGNSYELVKSAARAVYEQVRAGHVVYFHCHGGRDRTGIQAWLIEGLCGVSESDMSLDYELTHLAAKKKTIRTGNLKTSVRNFWSNVKLDLKGNTLQEKCNDWFLKAGFTQDEIDWYINYLLE